jgi:hypothetical protein
VVGRIMKAAAKPADASWLWTLAYGYHEDRSRCTATSRPARGRWWRSPAVWRRNSCNPRRWAARRRRPWSERRYQGQRPMGTLASLRRWRFSGGLQAHRRACVPHQKGRSCGTQRIGINGQLGMRLTRSQLSIDRLLTSACGAKLYLIALSSARRSGSLGMATRMGDEASAHAAHGQRNRPKPSVI